MPIDFQAEILILTWKILAIYLKFFENFACVPPRGQSFYRIAFKCYIGVYWEML